MASGDGFPDLRTYLDALEARGDLVRVRAEVDTDLELAEIQRRVIAKGGPALLFESVKGSPFRVAANLFGTAERVALAFGSRPREIVEEVAAAPRTLIPPSAKKLWAHRRLLKDLAGVGMKRGKRGAVHAVEDGQPDLRTLPATKSWEEDGGAFLTWGFSYTEHPDTGEHNLGLYRLQRHDAQTLGVHWQIGKGGGFHHARAEELGQGLAHNVFLGGPPAILLAAIAPLPENVPELLLASLVQRGKVRLGPNPFGPLPVLSEAEFVLVGEVPPKERRPEGPFGDHYGYYSLEHDFPYSKVKGMLRREDAILPITVVGKPRQEDFFIGDFLQDLLSPLFPLVMPAVVDLWSYGETGYHSLSAAVVRERYAREAMASAFRILGEGQLSLTKFLLLTDAKLDLKDFKTVLEHILARADFRRDLYLFGNLSMDTLDYAGPRINEGSKGVLIGIGDPIRKLPREAPGSGLGAIRDARVFVPGCLVLEGPCFAEAEDLGRAVAAHEAYAQWPMIVLVDDAGFAAKSAINFLWNTFTRFNPAADIHCRDVKLVHTQASYEPPIVIDARMKPHYPKELFCDERTAETVTRRWEEYFPGGEVAMGDSQLANLD